MRANLKSTAKLVTVLLASAALGLAQTSSYPTSNEPNGPPQGNGTRGMPHQQVQPGSVNYVEGQVLLDGQPVTPQSIGSTTLKPGQDLRTGSGYAEVLLTPGTFLRLGTGTDIQLESAGLANARVRLLSGTGLLEVDQLIDGTNLTVDLVKDSAQVLKKGLYDFDDSTQAVRVLDGKLRVDAASNTKTIGKNDQVMLANGDSLQKTGFQSKLVKDTELYTWSQARSQFEAGQNAVAAQNATYYTNAGTGWFWDPYYNFYGFWPASAYLYSPFGFGFYSPSYFGFYGGGFYGRPWRYGGYRAGYIGGVHGRVGGVSAHVSGFSAGASHAGGFHGGGHR